MNTKSFHNLFRLTLTLLCILSFSLPAWAAQSGPGSDTDVTVVFTRKAAQTDSTVTAAASEDTSSDPSPVLTCGTGEAAAAGAPAPETKTAPEASSRKGTSLGMFTTTGYCNCSICSGGHSLTYSGTVPQARHTVSADLSVFPIGTRLMIGGVTYTVEDMGSNVNGSWLDIYYDNHDAAVAHGTKTEEVFAVES